MSPLRLLETRPGHHSLFLADADVEAVEDTIEELGHSPNAHFWDGVARTLVRTCAPELEGRFALDSEAGTFVAHGADRDALFRLGSLLAPCVTDPDALRAVMADADPTDFED